MRKLWIGIIIVVFVTGFASASMAEDVPKMIRARSFELVDRKGNVKAGLRNIGNKPTLCFYGSDEEEKSALVVWDKTVALIMSSSGGYQPIVIGVDEVNKPSVIFFDKEGNRLISLGILFIEPGIILENYDKDMGGRAFLMPYSQASVLVLESIKGNSLSFATYQSGCGGVGILSENYENQAELIVSDYGCPALVMYDNKESIRFNTIIDTDGMPIIEMFDLKYNPCIEMAFHPTLDLPHIRLSDSTGKNSVQISIVTENTFRIGSFRNDLPRATLAMGDGGTPILSLWDDNRIPRAMMLLSQDEAPRLILSDDKLQSTWTAPPHIEIDYQ